MCFDNMELKKSACLFTNRQQRLARKSVTLNTQYLDLQDKKDFMPLVTIHWRIAWERAHVNNNACHLIKGKHWNLD